jgi:hypothetical protein
MLPSAMPIPIAELEKAAQPLAGRIVGFLESRSDEAFSVLEIIEAIEGITAADVPALVLAERRVAPTAGRRSSKLPERTQCA